jgi:hypothetical protein
MLYGVIPLRVLSVIALTCSMSALDSLSGSPVWGFPSESMFGSTLLAGGISFNSFTTSIFLSLMLYF